MRLLTSLVVFRKLCHDAKKCLIAAQQRQKAYADRYRRDIEFAVGSEVLLSTKHINIKMKGTTKLLPRWVGPFKVEQQVNPVAYKLDLPASLQDSPSVSCLFVEGL